MPIPYPLWLPSYWFLDQGGWAYEFFADEIMRNECLKRTIKSREPWKLLASNIIQFLHHRFQEEAIYCLLVIGDEAHHVHGVCQNLLV